MKTLGLEHRELLGRWRLPMVLLPTLRNPAARPRPYGLGRAAFEELKLAATRPSR